MNIGGAVVVAVGGTAFGRLAEDDHSAAAVAAVAATAAAGYSGDNAVAGGGDAVADGADADADAEGHGCRVGVLDRRIPVLERGRRKMTTIMMTTVLLKTRHYFRHEWPYPVRMLKTSLTLHRTWARGATSTSTSTSSVSPSSAWPPLQWECEASEECLWAQGRATAAAAAVAAAVVESPARSLYEVSRDLSAWTGRSQCG